MSEVKFQKAHTLGLPKARELARQWVDESTRQLGLHCKHEEGETQDTITFERLGVHGVMTVTGTDFDLHVKLGMMMSAFKPLIESEINRNMTRILGQASGRA